MSYIIFDLEWNQPYNKDLTYLKRANMEITGEIIQIGAVKLNDAMEVIDKFEIIVKPTFLSYVQGHIVKLTGISEEEIMNGVDFPKAMCEFATWCGVDPVILSWGSDDLLILLENLRVHHLLNKWEHTWYDAQRIYAWNINKDVKQVALKKALEHLNIELDIPQHNALNDSIYTAKILQKINFALSLKDKKVRDMCKSPLVVLPEPLDFTIYGKILDKREIFKTKSVIMTKCPKCHEELKKTSIEKTQGGRYMSIGTCDVHGSFSIYWRVHKLGDKGRDQGLVVTRSVGKTNAKINNWYYEKAEKNRIKYEIYQQRRLRKVQEK